MKEIFLEYINKLINNKGEIKVYDSLAKLFKKEKMYHEYASCLEKMWHKNKKPELCLEIGNIFREKLQNSYVAKIAYNRYLYQVDPNFCKTYINNLIDLGYEGFSLEDLTENCDSPIVDYCDKYNAIVHILIYLLNQEKYAELLELGQYLDVFAEKIEDFYAQNPNYDKCYDSDRINANRHLADLLSKVQHHNDINKFAIKLFPDIDTPYINIIADLIIYKNYDDAINFYNNNYCKAFEKEQTTSIIDLCWKISDIYRDKFIFFEAVRFQQIALEIELGK